MSKNELKRRFLAALNGASFAKLRECEVTLLGAISMSRAGTALRVTPEEARELLTAVRAMMAKHE